MKMKSGALVIKGMFSFEPTRSITAGSIANIESKPGQSIL